MTLVQRATPVLGRSEFHFWGSVEYKRFSLAGSYQGWLQVSSGPTMQMRIVTGRKEIDDKQNIPSLRQTKFHCQSMQWARDI
mmetsp:Transcript_6256/g.14117  ORF Transcript_6256/g.14117 Transcript_6256/m.14117 type:complete len:82 (+) Transcript_6256:855-1100(+)